jgi:hypothetical protein
LLLTLPAVMHAQFTYSTNYGGIAITGYSGGNNAVIPSTINGLPVAFIGSEAFYWITWLTSVTIPSSVTTIKNAAFYECTSLSEVYFQGNAPGLDGGNWFYGDNGATVYYLLGTTGGAAGAIQLHDQQRHDYHHGVHRFRRRGNHSQSNQWLAGHQHRE